MNKKAVIWSIALSILLAIGLAYIGFSKDGAFTKGHMRGGVFLIIAVVGIFFVLFMHIFSPDKKK